MRDIKDFKNDEFAKVAGGNFDESGYEYWPGDRKNGPCKYCGAVDSLVFDRTDDGWENGEGPYFCNVFKCEKCHYDNYFLKKDDHLLM